MAPRLNYNKSISEHLACMNAKKFRKFLMDCVNRGRIDAKKNNSGCPVQPNIFCSYDFVSQSFNKICSYRIHILINQKLHLKILLFRNMNLFSLNEICSVLYAGLYIVYGKVWIVFINYFLKRDSSLDKLQSTVNRNPGTSYGRLPKRILESTTIRPGDIDPSFSCFAKRYAPIAGLNCFNFNISRFVPIKQKSIPPHFLPLTP